MLRTTSSTVSVNRLVRDSSMVVSQCANRTGTVMLLEDVAGGAAEQHLAQAGVAVAAHDQEIGGLVAGLGEQDVGDAALPLATCRTSALTSCRRRWAASSSPGRRSVRPPMSRASTTRTSTSSASCSSGMASVGGACRLARAVPGHDRAPRRQHGRTSARDHQGRMAAVHEGGLGQRRVVDPVRFARSAWPTR